jgi:predicted Fe-Mo cluster-binding NifX family protein
MFGMRLALQEGMTQAEVPGMIIAVPVWNGRIAPVFDVARQVSLVETEGGRRIGERNEVLPEGDPGARILRLVELHVDWLICGAISRPVQEMAAAQGIRVVPFMAGEPREVTEAWLSGALAPESFAMPGCGGRRRRCRGGHACRKSTQTNTKE